MQPTIGSGRHRLLKLKRTAGVVTLFLILSGSPVWAQSLVDGTSSATAPAQSDPLVARGNSASWLDGVFIGTGGGATLVPLGTATDQGSFDDRFVNSYADAKNNESIITKAAPWATPAQMPAVDGINGSIGGYGSGANHTSGLYGTDGSLSVPIAQQFGAQFDGGVGSFDKSATYSGALHLFWRDPSIGLLGVYSSDSHWNGLSGFSTSVEHNAAEGEYYAGRWTLGGIAGLETVQTTSPVSIPTRGFDAVSASYYATDNFKLSIGHIYSLGANALMLGGEYGFALGGGRMAALFANGIIGEVGTYGVSGGVRFYFGQHDKTLIERNRQDDPSFQDIMNWFDNIRETLDGPFPPPPPPPAPSDDVCPAGEELYNNGVMNYCSP
ncbi:MAG TPA: hypothetical protein VIY68_02255 [Steroidobacteraceae bacterium]